MLYSYFNAQVNVQRRASNPSRNALNEPNYGSESSYPTAYSNIWCRIDYEMKAMEFRETGERVDENLINMMVDYIYVINPEDRITVQTSDHPSLVGRLFIAMTVEPDWDTIGSVHHYTIRLAPH